MSKYYFALFALLLFGLMSFSEGKPCPERTRPHKTRCNTYYKCTEIDNNKHVWVPAKCEEGLIYEHSLGVCVLPADDWECGHKTGNEAQKTTPAVRQTNAHKDADIDIVPSAEEEEENTINDKYDDSKVDIVIGTDISDEYDGSNDESEEVADALYDGSGNGGELVELDGFMQAPENRETDDVIILKGTVKGSGQPQPSEQKEELDEVMQTIKTKADIGQSSSNIDPKLTAHLQRLSQLIDGLKQTYQDQDEKEPQQELRPDQLNAFLAHFNIKNKFDTLDPGNGVKEEPSVDTIIPNTESNKTTEYKKDMNKKLNPETKVVLTNLVPKRYAQQSSNGALNSGGYSNSQIVVNRPEGAVLFTLPAEHNLVEHHEYSSDNSPKISEETLKTVLELSKQMIASQNVPKVIPNPFFGPPIMQPVFLTPHPDGPFSTNYYSGQNSPQMEAAGYPSVFSSDFHNQNYKHKKPGRKTQQGQNPTTIIHNNVIPVHLTSSASGDKEVLDSYGQSLGLYPPLNGQEERPDISMDYNDKSPYSYEPNKHSTPTTKRPSSISSTISPMYGNSPRPYDFQPTSTTFNKYFTPNEHLNEQNINNIFQPTDNYGSVPQPLKNKRPSSVSSQQSYKPNQVNGQVQDGYGSLFPQIDSHNVYGNSQPMYTEDQLQQQQPQYPDGFDQDDTDDITYSYGQSKPLKADGNISPQLLYPAHSSQSIFSSNSNNYMNRPSISNAHTSSLSSSSYGFSGSKNKYSSFSSPISSSSLNDGTQLVNVGGNFINYDVFQNSILPLMGGNSQTVAHSALNNVEVITCAAGTRQPNTTDCTRYYVCSKKDGKVLSYSCPPYTAFNGESRICDARTYAMCNPDATMPTTYSVSENKRIQMETIKALQEAKRRQALQQQQQQQAIKAQQFANMLQQYNPTSSLSNSNSLNSISTSGPSDSSEQNMLQSYMQQAAAMASLVNTTPRPSSISPTTKKRKYYCKEGDMIPDQTSINNYFVCYKNAQGQMKGHKRTCSKGLLFCPKTTMCTLPSKCS